MSVKIYTKTGDKGTTGLIGGTRLSKGDQRIEAYGCVDELNVQVGLLRDFTEEDDVKRVLSEIQDRLFTIGSTLATDPGKEIRMPLPDLHDSDIDFLEKEIDRMDGILPVQTHFILPGGAPAVSYAHLARVVCRRAERECIRLDAAENNVPPIVIKYLNRLSDYFFMVARYVGFLHGVPETAWRARISR